MGITMMSPSPKTDRKSVLNPDAFLAWKPVLNMPKKKRRHEGCQHDAHVAF
jgi:hypothetical protein